MYNSFASLGGRIQHLLRYPQSEDRRWSAFNPSLAKSPDGRIVASIRSSNYAVNTRTGHLEVFFGRYIMSRLWFAELNQDLKIESLREVQFDHGPLEGRVRRGVEDVRLFWRENGWHFSAVMLELEHTPYARMVVYRYDEATGIATFIEKLDGADPKRPEKNWMAPDQPTDAFDFIYSYAHTYKDGGLVALDDPPALKPRGGSSLILQPDGTYLAIVHMVSIENTKRFNPNTFAVETLTVREYRHLFARYNAAGRLVEASDEFIFEELGIEYAAGMVENGPDLVISFGQRDVDSSLAIIPKEVVIRMLRPVG